MESTKYTVTSNWQIVGWKNVADAPNGPRFDTKDDAREYRDNNRPVAAPYKPKWHAAPDGKPCCCTAMDRKHGLGCR